MSFDKSLRLINYAKNVNGKVQLFTELDHSFQVGDVIYINGGYYDNVFRLFTPSTNRLFGSGNGYKIIESKPNENSFIIDFNTSDIIYPYGTSSINKYGDTTNVASYLNDTNSDNYVYVSKLCIAKGRVRNININNGVFGTVNTTVKIDNAEISHVVSKNMEINTCNITCKTKNNVTFIKKLDVIEDLTIINDGSPFNVINIPTSLNNNDLGYSKFEAFKANNVVADCVDFSSYNVNLDINNLTATNIKIGNNKFVRPTSLKLDNFNITNGFMYGHTNKVVQNILLPPTKTKVCNNINYNNYIDIKPTNITLGIAGNCTLNVPYYTVAKSNISYYDGEIVFVNGITKNGVALRSLIRATINSSNYTFGDLTSAEIDLTFDVSDIDWVDVLANSSDYNFSNMVVSLYNNDDVSPIYFDMQRNNIISGYINAPISVGYLENNPNNIIYNSYLNNAKLHIDTPIEITNNSYSNFLIDNVKQYWSDNIIKTTPFCRNALINTFNDAPLSFKYINSLIKSGNHYDCQFSTSTITKDINKNTYLLNCTLRRTTVANDVIWNNVQILDEPVIQNELVVFPSQLGNRKTKWVTGFDKFAINTGANLNVVRTYIESSDFYNSIHKTNTNIIDRSKWENITTDIEIPGIIDYGAMILNNVPVVLLHDGRMNYNSTTAEWFKINNSRTIPLLVETIQTGDDLYNNIIDKNAETASLNTDYFNTNFPLPALNKGELYDVDENYVYKNLNTPTLVPNDLQASHSKIEVHQNITTVNGLTPDPLQPTNLSTIRMRLADILSVDDISDIVDTNTYVNNVETSRLLQFRLPGTMLNYLGNVATHIPNCFLEFEYIILNVENTLTSNISEQLLLTNYVFNNTTTAENNRIYGVNTLYTDLNKLITLPINPISFQYNNDYTFKLGVWFTWTYDNQYVLTNNTYYLNGSEYGLRTFHEFTFTIQCQP